MPTVKKDIIIKIDKLSKELVGLADILYPPECPVCQKLLQAAVQRDGVHPACYRQLKRIREPMCKKCGKPLWSGQQEYCYDCMRRQWSFEYGHGLWLYEAHSSASIFAFKYGRKRSYASFYARELLNFYGSWIKSLHVQQIIPVPVSRQKKRQRGFNQAELVAELVGEKLQIPVNTKGLLRIHSTAPQKALGKEERRKNLERAFTANSKYLTGIRRVLLLDDIYTTGNTIEYCTRALRAAGVEKIWFVALCIGGRF